MATVASTYPVAAGARGFAERHPSDRIFFPALIAAIWAMMLAGFVPELIERVRTDARPYPPIVHVHAVVFFGWLIFLAAQSGLIRTGHVRWHRRMGVVGMGLALVMWVLGPATGLTMQMLHQARQPPQFLSVQFVNSVVFIGFVAAALALRRQAAAHKRLILFGTLALTGAGFGRVIRNLTGGPAPPDLLIAPIYYGADLLILAIGLYDWRTRGRLHPLYLPAAAVTLASQACAGWLRNAPWWIDWTHRLVA